MIVKLQERGRSFKGAIGYIAHDKNGADTAERVAFFETGNMLTKDPEKAAKVMAWTDAHADDLKAINGVSTAGRKQSAGAVLHYMVSWERNENPDEQHQKETALSTLEKLGLKDHQYAIAGHDDTDNAHVHVVVNLTHPETGKRAELKFSKRDVQEFALQYEQEHGLHCEKRLENAEARAQEGAPEYYPSQKEKHALMVNRAYACSDNGASFKAALEMEGLTLAAGRKSFVAVDDEGNILNLSRMVDGARTKDIKAKLSDLDKAEFKNADELSAERKAQPEPFDKEADELRRQQELEAAALEHAKAQKDEPTAPPSRRIPHRELSPVEQVFYSANDGHDFYRQIKDTGNTLAIGNKGQFVLVNDKGSIQSLTKQLPDERYKNIDNHLADLHAENRQINIRDAEDVSGWIKENRYGDYQRKLDERMEDSRRFWSIDFLEEKHREAQKHTEEQSGFWARVLGRKREALEAEEAARLTLEDANSRYLADIREINKNRPQWVIDYEIEKRTTKKTEHAQSEETGRGDTGSVKPSKETAILQEAAASPEAAERLEHAATATTAKDKGILAKIHSLVSDKKAKDTAQKKAVLEREKQRQDEAKRAEEDHKAALLREQIREQEAAKARQENTGKKLSSLEQAQQKEVADQFKHSTAQGDIDSLRDEYDSLEDDLSKESQIRRAELHSEIAKREQSLDSDQSQENDQDLSY